LQAKSHKAESVFESVERSNTHKESWTNPSGCEHQQGFVMMSNGTSGLAIANIGLYEYETMDNTIAITLLRAVSEIGDWGVFPTELSQLQDKLCVEYAIVPYSEENEVYPEVSAFQTPILHTTLRECNGITLEKELLNWDGNFMRLTACKNKLNHDDLILRWVNYSDKEQILTIQKTKLVDNLYRSNIIEEKGEALQAKDGVWQIAVQPYEIITLGVEGTLWKD